MPRSNRTINPDIIQKTLDILQKHFRPADITIDKDSIIYLSDPARRNVLLRIPLQSSLDTVPKSVILKQSLSQPNVDNKSVDDKEAYSRFSRDWAGLEFANSLKQSVHNVPQFYGGDKDHRFILIEDLGNQHISLVDSLLSANRDKAVLALGRYMKALGSFHAASFSHTGAYENILKRINENVNAAQDDLACMTKNLLLGIGSACQTLSLSETKGCIDEVRQIVDSMFKLGPFTVLIHGDIAPDNVFDHEDSKELQLIDFEWSFPRNALLDGTYLRMSMPTGWCAKAIPNDVIKVLEQIYRDELKVKIPSASNNLAFATAYTQACGYHVLHEMSKLTGILKEDVLWESDSAPKDSLWKADANWSRPRFLSRLQAFVDVATEHNLLPNLKQMAENMLVKVKELWPADTKPLDLYPAFQTPIPVLDSKKVTVVSDFFKASSSLTDLLHKAMPKLGGWYNFREEGFALHCHSKNEAQHLKKTLTEIFSSEISSKAIAVNFQVKPSGMVFLMLKTSSVNKLGELLTLHKDKLALIKITVDSSTALVPRHP